MFESKKNIKNSLLRKLIIRFLIKLIKLVSKDKGKQIEYDFKSNYKVYEPIEGVIIREYHCEKIDKLPLIVASGGYPTEEFIIYIQNWAPDGDVDFIGLLKTIIDKAWEFSDWGIVIREANKQDLGEIASINKRKKTFIIEFHTGGWSGNEMIIDAILRNVYLANYEMHFYKFLTGGHYYFKISNRHNKKIKEIIKDRLNKIKGYA